MSAAPAQEWWTSSELAAACLPDLPSARQPLERLIEREGWRSTSQARRRQGRGGGWEYHWSLLPIRARRQLLRETGQTSGAKALAKKAPDRAALWSWFDGLPEAVKAEARRRLAIVQNVEGLVATGLTKYEAVAQVELRKEAGARDLAAITVTTRGRGAHAAPPRGPNCSSTAPTTKKLNGRPPAEMGAIRSYKSTK